MKECVLRRVNEVFGYRGREISLFHPKTWQHSEIELDTLGRIKDNSVHLFWKHFGTQFTLPMLFQ